MTGKRLLTALRAYQDLHRNGTIALTRSERIEGETEVLNIEVDDLHTYLVGPSALVVHNK